MTYTWRIEEVKTPISEIIEGIKAAEFDTLLSIRKVHLDNPARTGYGT